MSVFFNGFLTACIWFRLGDEMIIGLSHPYKHGCYMSWVDLCTTTCRVYFDSIYVYMFISIQSLNISRYFEMYAGVEILWWSVGISGYFLSNQHYQINFEGFIEVFFIYSITLISYPLKNPCCILLVHLCCFTRFVAQLFFRSAIFDRYRNPKMFSNSEESSRNPKVLSYFKGLY